ncbi:hypothetical protein BJ165DRAFT_985049 [Panaeolus papilionaceus]|nr:hypothetical protein BJ165DRAFT_985049 [Panaeolus papilionaceus]
MFTYDISNQSMSVVSSLIPTSYIQALLRPSLLPLLFYTQTDHTPGPPHARTYAYHVFIPLCHLFLVGECVLLIVRRLRGGSATVLPALRVSRCAARLNPSSRCSLYLEYDSFMNPASSASVVCILSSSRSTFFPSFPHFFLSFLLSLDVASASMLTFTGLGWHLWMLDALYPINWRLNSAVVVTTSYG